MFLKTPLQPLFPRLPFLRKAAAVFQNAGKVLFEWKPKRLAVQRSFLQRIDHRVTPVWLLPPIWQRWEITNFKPIFRCSLPTAMSISRSEILRRKKQEHKVSYRCSLPSPLQKGSKDWEVLIRLIHKWDHAIYQKLPKI